MTRLIVLYCLFMALMNPSYAQTGSIRGKVIDRHSGEPIIGAMIEIKKNKMAAISDLDGAFVFMNIKEGIYDLDCSYLGYGNQRILGLKVREDGIKLAYFKLQEGDPDELGIDVVVTADVARYMEGALLAKRKKNPRFVEFLSSEEIFKTGDQDLAQALKRLTGVNIEQNRFAYVRGLGGRYVNVLLNGAAISQSDVHYNAIDLRQFPSDIIDNVALIKTYTPEMMGGFAGGTIDMVTKAFPEKFTFNASLDLAYNPSVTFASSYLTYPGGAIDWLGLDDGTRAKPSLANNIPSSPNLPTSAAEVNAFNSYTGSFRNNFGLTPAIPFFDTKFSASVGDKITLGKDGKKAFTYGATISYKNTNSNYFETARTERHWLTGDYDLTDTLTPILRMSDVQSTNDVRWTVYGNLGFKSKEHKVEFNFMRTQSGKKQARNISGVYDALNPDWTYHTCAWFFEDQVLTTAQLKTTQLFNEKGDFKLNVSLSASNSGIQNPDLRYFSEFNRPDSTGGTEFKMEDTLNIVPARFFRGTNDWNISGMVNLDIPLPFSGAFKPLLKIGGSSNVQTRELFEERFNYVTRGTVFNGSTSDYFDNSNFIEWDATTGAPSETGLYVYNATLPNNNYKGFNHVGGAYLQVELPILSNFEIIAGLRWENTTYKIDSYFGNTFNTVTDTIYNHFIPAFLANYSISEKMNIKASYSTTLARPGFREVAPFESFDYAGDFIRVGNPNLTPTLIHNADLRWEWFPKLKEVIAVGAFMKCFDAPVEYITDPSNSQILTYQNSAYTGWVVGGEIEVRKKLDFMGEWAENLRVIANFAYIFSTIQIDETEMNDTRLLQSDAQGSRPFTGQAPYVVNAGFDYLNEKLGLRASVMFNVTGSRLRYVMYGATPDIYELPKPELDINITQKVGKYVLLRLSARNLLNSPLQLVQNYKGTDYYYRRYTFGQEFLIGASVFIE